ncbi:Meiotically up-regulated protein [Lasiodiplodia theobromae]|uniref:Meiotically up-regulated protein n=1 Tax=Lasiodiplodia theobromae TaxID=45133 RepID=UPI0015C33AA9|nr:Meiotically up-regulated protein [Lasiodiplodia theobromae]KAF4540603.1 Meiotically up-regulated protein [Lasiodiplodia theobromae]
MCSNEDDDFEMLRIVIHYWLCEQHSHWFWLDFYYDLWVTEIGCDDELDESVEDEPNENIEDESDERVEDESDESADDESHESADDKSHESVEECSSTESNSAVAAKESSSEKKMFASEHGGPNSPPITINIAIQEYNYYAVSAQQSKNEIIGGLPESQSTPQTPQSLHNLAQGVLPASVLRLVPESRNPGVSEVPVRSSTLNRNRSQQETPNRGTTPTLDGLVAGVSRLDLKDSPLESKRKPRRAKNDAESLNSPFDIFIKRLVRKLEKCLAKNLGERLSNEIKLGYIYVLTSTDKPGLVKIGYAGDDPEKRIKAEDVPHFRHVEKLIHCQLDPLMKEWDCEPEKNRTHREWFRCKPDFAAKVVDTWAEWMKGEPYAHGVLREKWAARVYEELERDKQGRKDEVFVDMIARHRRLLEQT